MKILFKFSTDRDSNSNKWLDALWLHCRDTPFLGCHSWAIPQYHSRSTLDSTPSTSPFDTLGTCKQEGKMAPWWGGPRACFGFHQSYNRTRFLYSSRTHHLGVSHVCCSRWGSCHRPSKQNHHSDLWDSVLFCKCSIDLLIKLYLMHDASMKLEFSAELSKFGFKLKEAMSNFRMSIKQAASNNIASKCCNFVWGKIFYNF